ncbi:MAG: hypothetical protein Fur0022_21820 [Anaerolineales bacterium]
MNLKKYRSIVFMGLVLILLISATTVAFAKSERVKFTVENNSNKIFTLRMTGPESLYLVVQPNTTQAFTPLRGEYLVTMYSCGSYADDQLDLTTIKTMVVPACGSNGPDKSDKKIDASDTIKLVKITIENDATSSTMVVVMTGPDTFVFSFKAGQKASYTVPRGEYNVTYYACNSSATRPFTAKANKVLELSCPK